MDKIEAEKNDYRRLKDAGIRIPLMLSIDEDSERIVKDSLIYYVDYECNQYKRRMTDSTFRRLL
ncbi:MAG: hypothetical protein II842_16745 [Butyrivibrio sp.]|nr:hypothetical protein [Butyrivibrio sp.]